MYLTRGGKAYQAQKAIMKPNHEKKKTLPYMLIGFRAGIDRAFLLMGLTSGALYRSAKPKPRPMTAAACSEARGGIGVSEKRLTGRY